jgi:hypothetical protein
MATNPSPIRTRAKTSPISPPITAADTAPAITSNPAEPNEAIRERLLTSCRLAAAGWGGGTPAHCQRHDPAIADVPYFHARGVRTLDE